MSTPFPTPELHPFADQLADIRSLQQRVATATRALLRKHGWRYTCLNPARCWLWAKNLPGGRTILTDLDTALAIEASLAGQPLFAAAPAPARPSRAEKTNAASAPPPVPSAADSPP